jgi:hypothetical protein
MWCNQDFRKDFLFKINTHGENVLKMLETLPYASGKNYMLGVRQVALHWKKNLSCLLRLHFQLLCFKGGTNIWRLKNKTHCIFLKYTTFFWQLMSKLWFYKQKWLTSLTCHWNNSYLVQNPHTGPTAEKSLNHGLNQASLLPLILSYSCGHSTSKWNRWQNTLLTSAHVVVRMKQVVEVKNSVINTRRNILKTRMMPI